MPHASPSKAQTFVNQLVCSPASLTPAQSTANAAQLKGVLERSGGACLLRKIIALAIP